MWIDITMPMHKNMPIWPGDTPFSYKLDATLHQDGANVGSIQMSLHTGTHVDAPYHYDDFGKAVDVLPIDLFMGKVLVVDVTGTKEITIQHVQQLELEKVERIFFKTKVHYDLYKFQDNFTVIAPKVVEYLAQFGIRIIGTDAPSVDAVKDQHLRTHHACRVHDIYIIENLWLKDAVEGFYEFIGLPLTIQGADASPIRAIIKKLNVLAK